MFSSRFYAWSTSSSEEGRRGSAEGEGGDDEQDEDDEDYSSLGRALLRGNGDASLGKNSGTGSGGNVNVGWGGLGDGSDRGSEVVDEEFELLVQAYMHDIHYTSRPQAINNLCYAILNAGIVALPYAAYQAGLPLFMFSIVLMSLVAGYTTCMVIAMAEDTSSSADDASYNHSYSRLVALKPVTRSVRTLEDLCELSFGKRGYYLVSIFQVLLSLVLMSLSLEIWAEIINSVLVGHLGNSQTVKNLPLLHSLVTTRNGAVFLGSIVVLPLVLRSAAMSSLRWTAYASVLAVATGLLSVVYAFAVDRNADSSPIPVSDVSYCKSGWWAVCFIVTLCFSYNQKTFSVYSCLRRRSTKRWQYSVKRASGVIVVLYLVFGIFGYLSHVEEGDRLNRFNYYLDFDSGGSTFFDVTRSIVAASLLFTIPVDCLVAATTLRRVYLRARCGAWVAARWLWLAETFPLLARVCGACGFWRVGWGSGSRDWAAQDGVGGSGALSRGARSDYDVKQAAAATASVASNPAVVAPLPPPPSSPGGTLVGSSTGRRSMTHDGSERSERSDGSDFMGARQNSIVDIMNQTGTEASCWFPEHVIPALLFWGLSVGICCGVENWVVVAATFGSVSTSILVLVLPSMLYFRLGLSSDYRAAPLFSSGPLKGVIPNQLYMLAVQVLGVFLLMGNIACGIYVVFFSDTSLL